MSAKEKFTAEEWETIVQSPMLAGLAIIAADPGDAEKKTLDDIDRALA